MIFVRSFFHFFIIHSLLAFSSGFPKVTGKRMQLMGHSDVPLDQPNVTPKLLRTLYKINLPVASQGVNNTQAVFENAGICHSKETSLWFKTLTPLVKTRTPTLIYRPFSTTTYLKW